MCAAACKADAAGLGSRRACASCASTSFFLRSWISSWRPVICAFALVRSSLLKFARSSSLSSLVFTASAAMPAAATKHVNKARVCTREVANLTQKACPHAEDGCI